MIVPGTLRNLQHTGGILLRSRPSAEGEAHAFLGGCITIYKLYAPKEEYHAINPTYPHYGEQTVCRKQPVVFPPQRRLSVSMNLDAAVCGLRAACAINRSVAPGPVWTPLIPSSYPAEEVSVSGTDALLGRAAQAYEPAGVYVYLAGPDSTYVTGTCIHVNGGDMVTQADGADCMIIAGLFT